MDVDGLAIIGRGRSSLVFAVGDGTVIRRHHSSTYDAQAEAEAMRVAAAIGVPVPIVHDVAGPDIRMDRVDGPTLLRLLLSHPERADEGGAVLAGLHHSLDVTREAGHELVHGDLHPDNVIMTTGGPVLIDWTNHRRAPRAVDVALTWIVLSCFDPDDAAVTAGLTGLRPALLDAFLDGVDRRDAVTGLAAAAEIRRADPATTAAERVRIDQLCRAASG